MRDVANHLSVWKGTSTGKWWASGFGNNKPFLTWAEAIAYADHMARTNQGENNEGLK